MRIGMPFSQEQFLSNLRDIDRRLGDALAQLSLGRRVTSASDDPQAAARILQLEDQRRALETRENGVGLARTQLQLSENALRSLNDLLVTTLTDATQAA
jgi:flagellar hook-associated protein 3 FlgL